MLSRKVCESIPQSSLLIMCADVLEKGNMLHIIIRISEENVKDWGIPKTVQALIFTIPFRHKDKEMSGLKNIGGFVTRLEL